MPFHWSQFIIYLMPMFALLLVVYFRKLFAEESLIKIAAIDCLHPIFMISIHMITELTFYFSLLPVYFILLGLVGLVGLYQNWPIDHKEKVSHYLHQISRWMFTPGFGLYLIVLFLRSWQILS